MERRSRRWCRETLPCRASACPGVDGRRSMTGAAGTSGRATQGARTRERLLASAREILAEHGPDGFTTRRVAQRAGVSHGMVHYHFEGKRDLLLALLIQARRDWIEPLEELVDGPGSAEGRMRDVIAWMAEP